MNNRLNLRPIITPAVVRVLTPGARPNSGQPRIWEGQYSGSPSGVGGGHTTPRRKIT